LKPLTRINAMDDFAMPGVARTKQAWRPCELVVSYTATLNRPKRDVAAGSLKGKTTDAHQER
jgi:hypothetical protein